MCEFAIGEKVGLTPEASVDYGEMVEGFVMSVRKHEGEVLYVVTNEESWTVVSGGDLYRVSETKFDLGDQVAYAPPFARYALGDPEVGEVVGISKHHVTGEYLYTVSCAGWVRPIKGNLLMSAEELG